MTHTESTYKIRSTYTYTYQNIDTRIQNSPHTCTHMTLVKSGSCWQSFSQ